MQKRNVVYSLIADPTYTKVLMVRNKDENRWSLPGGEVEANETLAAAAVRETKEETGLDIMVQGVVAVNECIMESRQAQVLFVTFGAEIVGGQQQILHPDEIVEIAWVELDQVSALMLVPSYENEIGNMIRKQREAFYKDEGRV